MGDSIKKLETNLSTDIDFIKKRAVQGHRDFFEGVDVQVSGNNISAVIRNFKTRLVQRFAPHAEVGEFMVARTKASMERQETPDGAKWDGLSDATKTSRAARGFPKGPALRETGELQRRIQWKVGGVTKTFSIPFPSRRSGISRIGFSDLAKETFTRIAPNKLGQKPKGKTVAHQGFGLGTFIMTGKGRKTPTPSRPYLDLTRNDEKVIELIFDNYIRTSLRKSITSGGRIKNG